jgi:hypothetical protein
MPPKRKISSANEVRRTARMQSGKRTEARAAYQAERPKVEANGGAASIPEGETTAARAQRINAQRRQPKQPQKTAPKAKRRPGTNAKKRWRAERQRQAAAADPRPGGSHTLVTPATAPGV